MNFRTRLAAAAAASIVLAGLAGCAPSAPAPGPASDPAPIDAPATEQPGVIDTTFLDEVVAGNRSSTATLIEQWEGEDCTVQAAVDGGTMCSTYLSTGALTIQTYEAILTDYQPGSGELDEVFAAVDESKAAATEWTDAECNWETTEDCAAAGQTIIDGVYALEDALAAWESAR
ncbi:MAG TPA: hypothetical protein VN200_06915 [Rhodoglobus sp.]|nr:hypothetical protein [Rhodoglobus sp.]